MGILSPREIESVGVIATMLQDHLRTLDSDPESSGHVSDVWGVFSRLIERHFESLVAEPDLLGAA